MTNDSLRNRILKAMDAQKMSKADLSKRSGVPYHTLDKFLKGITSKTSHENGVALESALGIKAKSEVRFEELRQAFLSLSEEKQRFALDAIRGLAEPLEPQGRG